ncbi:hypothetical protein GCK72_015131 [Caenorhabditis remanei]|uniref:Uncharacterized protein n=1 Tax=Caenorhabditis remanei TaxID=31234 RepID=A0A6A5GWE9_CAERE|nr:hypothetical protein GCK72_015131 [Caenorhabditis remanei]KAF1758672.1 hypothetical protein GCK72_015131 [Caenorhabditis remanei]
MLSKLFTTSCLVAIALSTAQEDDVSVPTKVSSTKRRQYVAAQQPAVPVVAPVGQCPGGPSLPIECDPKRPWPQCPPQSYCYATNSVDIGPYFCCPVWSTYGAAWRPATPFYNYVPPVPANWPDVAKMTANWPAAAVSVPVKARKPTKSDGDNEEDQLPDGISSSINSWVQRQKL